MAKINVKGLSRRGFRLNSNSRVNYATATEVDLDNYPDARYLSAHDGDYYTVPELDFTVSFPGAVTQGAKRFFISPYGRAVDSASGTLSAASTAGDVEVSIGRIPADEGTDGVVAESITLVIEEGETVGTVEDGPVKFGPNDIVVVEVLEEGADATNLSVSFSLR